MIRVIVTGLPREGRFPYRIETEGTRLASPITGLSATPMWDACRRLKDMGAADDSAQVGMWVDTDQISDCRLACTVEEGARPPEEPREETAEEPSDETTATPSAEPPSDHTEPELQDDMDRVARAPDKPKQSHPKRKPTKSGARQSRR
jgi:hypothetical protein